MVYTVDNMDIKVKPPPHLINKKKNKNDAEKTEEREKMKKNLVIPLYKDASSLLDKRVYSLYDLKEICRHYKLKVTGNKTELYESILTIFRHIKAAYMIQSNWKKYAAKIYSRLRGPARFNRQCCINESDFYTMDPLKEIPYRQFFSYKDNDNIVYGFDILSLILLFEKGGCNETNPYTRQPFPANMRDNMNRLAVFSKILFGGQNITEKEESSTTGQPDSEKSIAELVAELFIEIDSLGNYTSVDWFLLLSQYHLIRFMQILYDIWIYRANLTQQVRNDIFPPAGNPFQDNPIYVIHNSNQEQARRVALNIMNKFVRAGINRDSRCLGTSYVLCALTLVSPAAAAAMPWLYYSVSLE
jgi:hypothetical protein